MKLRLGGMALAIFFGCSGKSAEPIKVTATVGPLGGVVEVPGGPMLNIVPNALAADTVITIQARPSSPQGALSTVYELGPEGIEFARPVTLAIPVADSVKSASIYLSKPGSVSDFDTLPAMVASGVASTSIDRVGRGYAGPASGKTRTVSGSFSTIFWSDDGTKTTRPFAFGPAMTVPAIWIPAGNNYKRVPASPTPGADFYFANVPEGPYLLEVDLQWDASTTWVRLIELTSDTPDLSSVVAARPDLRVPTQPTRFTLDVTGLTPWVPRSQVYNGDMLLFAGSQAHVYVRPQTVSAEPAAGATTWHASWDWSRSTTAFALGLPDASKGDVEFFYQRSSTFVGGDGSNGIGVAHVAKRFARLDNLTIRDGVASGASATLADAPQTGRLRANLRNSKWSGLLTDANPAAQPSRNQGVSVLAIPHSLDFPDQPGLAASSSLIHVEGLPQQDADYGTVNYGQFLGPTWKEARYVLYIANANVPTPSGVTYPAQPVFTFYQAMPADHEIVPVLGPPRSPRINDRDAFQAQTGVGLHPTISWKPPRLGAATSYVVRLDQVGATPAGPAAIELTVYGVTSVQVPDGLLAQGAQYAVTITSVSAPWDELDRPPFRSGMPYSTADCVTAVFSP